MFFLSTGGILKSSHAASIIAYTHAFAAMRRRHRIRPRSYIIWIRFTLFVFLRNAFMVFGNKFEMGK